MNLILEEDVESLGTIGTIVKVKRGYGRNYLLPRGLASRADEKNEKAAGARVRRLQKKKELAVAEAKKIASVIEKTSVTVSKKVGEDERIFGSVTTAELEALLKAEGLDIDRKDIRLEEEVKKVGVYSAVVKLRHGVSATFKLWVVAQ